MEKGSNNSSFENEEEFQFTEEEPVEHETRSQQFSHVDAGNNVDNARRKKMWLIIIGVLVALFCVYKLYGLFTATSSHALKEPLSTKTSIAKVENIKPENVKSETPKPQENKPAKLESEVPLNLAPPKLEEKETVNNSGLSEKVSSLQSSQGNLQTQISGLSSAITEIQNNISMLTQQVGEIVQQKNKTSTETKTPETTEVKNEAKQPIASTNNNKKKIHHSHTKFSSHLRSKTKSRIYYIRSLIQGRAWLVTADGATLTVGIGDYLNGYGKILTIKTDEGVVTTSSGKNINFMPQDR